MLQHRWSVDYESYHQLFIWWIITAQNMILHFITRIQDLMQTMTSYWRKSSILSNVIVILQSLNAPSVCFLLSKLQSPSQPWSSHYQVSQPQLEEHSRFLETLVILKVTEMNTSTPSSCILNCLLCANDCKLPSAVHSLTMWVTRTSAPLRLGKVEIWV